MGDMGDYWNDIKEHRKKQRERLGIDCPGCPLIQPKRIPTRLMPGQQCKVCGHQDRRSGRRQPPYPWCKHPAICIEAGHCARANSCGD